MQSSSLLKKWKYVERKILLSHKYTQPIISNEAFLSYDILFYPMLLQAKVTTPLLDPKSVAHHDKEGREVRRTNGVKDSLV